MSFHALIVLPHKVIFERHLSLTLAAGVEIISFILSYFLLSSGRRRTPLCTFQLVVSSACLLIAITAIYPPGISTGLLGKIFYINNKIRKIINIKKKFIQLTSYTLILSYFIYFEPNNENFIFPIMLSFNQRQLFHSLFYSVSDEKFTIKFMPIFLQ